MAPCGNVQEKKFLARTLTGCYLSSALHVNVLNAMYSTRLCVCVCSCFKLHHVYVCSIFVKTASLKFPEKR